MLEERAGTGHACRRDYRREVGLVDEEDTDDDEDDQGQDLGSGGDVVDRLDQVPAEEINNGKEDDQPHRRPVVDNMVIKDWQEALQRGQQGHDFGSQGAAPQEPGKDTKLITGEAAKGVVGIQPGCPGPLEPARQVGVAEGNHRNRQRRAQQDEDGRQVHVTIDNRREQEGPGPDDTIDP